MNSRCIPDRPPGVSSPSPSNDWMQNNNSTVAVPEKEKEKEGKEALKKLLEVYQENVSLNIEKERPPSKKNMKSLSQENPFCSIPGNVAFLHSLLHSSSTSFSSPSIPEECLSLFDTLCSELEFRHEIAGSEGAGPDSTITITLENKELIGTPFHGAKVVIEEYSTAPKAFNVYIKTGQESAFALIQAHMADFLQYIESKKLSFSINQVYPEYLDEFSSSKEDQDSSTDPDAEQEQSP